MPGQVELDPPHAPILPAMVALLLALSGCGADVPTEPRQPDPPRARVSLIAGDRARSEADLPPGCSLPQVRRAFEELLSGANAGDRSRLLGRVASPPELNPFMLGRDSRSPTGDARDPRTRLRTPARIWRYFARQSSRGYRRHLLDARVEPVSPGTGRGADPFRRPAAGPTADDPVVAAGFTIEATDADGLSWNLSGKAGINCASGRFYFYGGG